jgi:hypothetical protein
LYRRLGGPKGRSGRVGKISPPPGIDPRNVKPVTSDYRLSYPSQCVLLLLLLIIIIIILGQSEEPVALQMPTTHINNNIFEPVSYLTENTNSLLYANQTVKAVQKDI